jgi:hypothetical protein
VTTSFGSGHNRWTITSLIIGVPLEALAQAGAGWASGGLVPTSMDGYYCIQGMIHYAVAKRAMEIACVASGLSFGEGIANGQ